MGFSKVASLVLALTTAMEADARSDAITPGDFRGWFDAACRGKLKIPRDVARRARGDRYVFVGGFWSEGMPGYFAQNAHELRRSGVPEGSIHFIFPSSARTVVENRTMVEADFRKVLESGPERLVVVAHSRGACDVLDWALRHPEIVRDRVTAMFLVQGAFGGSKLASLAANEGEAEEIEPAWMVWVERRLAARGWDGSLAAMRPEASRTFWKKALADHAEAIPVVGPRVFYVATRAPRHRLPLFLRVAAGYLGEDGGPNDGVVPVEGQSLPGLGTRLGVLEASHSDLTRRFPAARPGQRFRKALIRSILMAVDRSERRKSAQDG